MPTTNEVTQRIDAMGKILFEITNELTVSLAAFLVEEQGMSKDKATSMAVCSTNSALTGVLTQFIAQSMGTKDNGTTHAIAQRISKAVSESYGAKGHAMDVIMIDELEGKEDQDWDEVRRG